ncbi:PIG-L deacetylase family protein [uncultured Microbacterium sp.]|uniref:PIG-L deacetylase family protein n=1 Tax=uncultured Microbacterium sp. TaxID=191216 RepID=UPI0035CA0201
MHQIETIAMFWAHYDDDLVFANPTLLQALADGHRAHTFFFTGSDAGKGVSEYADGRERGIRAAYDTMRGGSGAWSDETVVLSSGLTVTVTRPDGDDRISLSFLRLPDGGLRGGGYAVTGWHSLPKLLSGELPAIRTIDDEQSVTLEQLRSTVAELVALHDPTIVIANYPGFEDVDGDDHPDHQTVGRVVASVVEAGVIPAEKVRYAIGYPGARRPANIDPILLDRKLTAFAAYGANDPVVAREAVRDYLGVRGFGEWLQREYLVPHSELGPHPQQ